MKALFAAQDPGGANAIVPVAVKLHTDGVEVMAYVQGPAATIFAAQNVPITDTSVLPDAQIRSALERENPDIAVVATSVGDSIDKKILNLVHDRCPSLTVIDYPSNYWPRFSTSGATTGILPDRICVLDNTTKQEMIAEGFESAQIVVTGNPHFDTFADGITCDGEEHSRILFVSQPLRLLASEPGFRQVEHDEYKTVEALIAALPPSCHVSIRLHPKEPADKYDTYLSKQVSIAKEKALEESISRADLVVGIMTPVLMQAAAAGKKVLSYEPGLLERDPMISNRVGVTTRIGSAEELVEALRAYAAGQ